MPAPHPRPSTVRRARRRTRALVAGLAAVGLAASACVDDQDRGAQPGPGTTAPSTGTSSDGGIGTDGTDGIVLASLRTASSCDALLGELKAEALERVGPYGLGGSQVHTMRAETAAEAGGGDDMAAPGGGDGRAASPVTGAPTTAAPEAGEAAPGHSATNVQEEGVDEADAVKTDGRRLVVVSASTVRVVDLSGGAPVLQHTIELGDEVHGGELFLAGDRAVLLSTAWTATPTEGDIATSSVVPAGAPATRLVELDLAGGRVVRSLEVEGSYLSGRAAGGTVRVVVSNPQPSLPFLLPSGPGAEAAAEAANRQIIEASTIDDWLPAYRWLDAAGRPTGEEGPIVPCERLHLPAEFAGFGTLSVLTFQASDVSPGEAVSVLTDGDTVYASSDRLVVATARWIDPRVWESGDEALVRQATEDYSTALHTFELADGGAARYVASGSVEGRLLNQFSLDEHEGLVRVATTDGELWGDQPDSQSYVTVLREHGDRLELVGQVGGLGPGEQIQSVRFTDEVAYVVTFRQIDPLYVVDLSDPANPRVAGELKIPGFSSYLHPISDEMVVGVGQDATSEGRVTGAQLSVFDVSDATDPQRVGQLDLGRDSSSLAGHDHRAFLWWEPQRLAVLPLSQWRWEAAGPGGAEGHFEGAVVVNIDEAGQPVEVARLSHPSVEECAPGMPRPLEGGDGASDQPRPEPEECWTWQPPISRSVVVDDVLYTVSDAGVLATGLGDLQERGFARFPR